jgi:rfaE bifunctional protein nucleotidyltransferase chain/domain
LAARNNKIYDLRALADHLDERRRENGKLTVVHCHGVFDLLHIGHIRHFEEARQMGDVLVVTLTADQYVNKGPHRPAFNEGLRLEAIAALEFVDYVALNEWPTAVETIKLLKPNLYVKGSDYRNADEDITGKIVDEADAVKSVGGEVSFTDDIVFSSSELINRHLSPFSQDVRDFLENFAHRHSMGEIGAHLESIRGLRTLIVGEAIIDEYQFCKAMGSSTKEPILSVQYDRTERFAGGVLAMANHVANFCDTVGVLTMLGAQNSQQEFIERKLHPDIERIFFYKENSPTVVKRRFIEGYLAQKLFQVYEINNTPLSAAQSEELCTLLEAHLPQYDVVIVVDYGHQMLAESAIETLTTRSRFLAVNTQANAGNRGFNTISRYPRADFISLASHEIALEERNRSEDYHAMIRSLKQKVDCPQIMVTRGKFGILNHHHHDGFVETPAFAGKVVDRMGTGDAVLSVTALLAAQNTPTDIIGFVGNAVGAQAVGTLGHERSIDPVALQKFMTALMK